jgi:predicted nucleic acid-binding protein
MNKLPRIYWDSSCFICLLNRSSEQNRRLICEDVIRHAQNGEFEIWTSTWTIVEVIRPKKKYGEVPPLPAWAVKAFSAAPEGKGHFQTIWDYYYKHTGAPSTKLTPEQIAVINGMFGWECIRTAYLDQRTASKAVEISRDCGLKPADAVHAATALLSQTPGNAPVLQRWDRDYERVSHLMRVEEPKIISAQSELISDYKKPILDLPE